MKDLGYANSWGEETPEEVVKCNEMGHRAICWSRNAGRCVTEHGCSVCDYKYKVDSSD